MRNILLSAANVLLAGTTLVGSVHSAELPKGAAHNIVLVHGAFVDETSWQPVADILTKKGYNVTLVENPLTSLAADVDATKQALVKQDGRTVLVGHSWGGVVITQAGNDPKVSALVYVSAFAPEVGESLTSLAKAGPPTEGGKAIHPDAKGNLHIDPKVFPSAVAADLPPEIAEHLANSQLPLNHVAFEAPSTLRPGMTSRRSMSLARRTKSSRPRLRSRSQPGSRLRRRKSPAVMPRSSSMRSKSLRSSKRQRSPSDGTAPDAFAPGARTLAQRMQNASDRDGANQTEPRKRQRHRVGRFRSLPHRSPIRLILFQTSGG